MSSLLVIRNKHLRDGGNDWKNMKTFESLDSLPTNHLPLQLNICLHLNIWWNLVELKRNCCWERDNATAIYSNDLKWCHLQQWLCYGCCIVNESTETHRAHQWRGKACRELGIRSSRRPSAPILCARCGNFHTQGLPPPHTSQVRSSREPSLIHSSVQRWH